MNVAGVEKELCCMLNIVGEKLRSVVALCRPLAKMVLVAMVAERWQTFQHERMIRSAASELVDRYV